MYCSRKSFTFLQRLSLRVAFCLFWGVFSLFGLKLARQWTKANCYLVFAAFLIGICLLLVILARLFCSSVSLKRLRWSAFLLISATSLIFVILKPLPITSVMIKVIHIPRSMEFFLQHHQNDTLGEWQSVFRARGDSHTMVSFQLPRPIRGQQEDIEIYMGYNPQRLHFGRLVPQVEIDKVAFGTTVVFWPLLFTVYKGQELSPGDGVISGSEFSAFLGNRVRAPKIDVMWDERRVRKDSIPIRITLIKLIWATLYFGLSAAIIWSGHWLPRMKPMWKAVEKFLMQFP